MEESEKIERGNIELIEGRGHEPVTSIAVKVVGSVGGSALILDGSSTVNPYYMVNECKKRGYDEKIILRKIKVSRAFTAYQFKDLVSKAREKLENRDDVNFLGVISMSPLFEDDELSDVEGRWMRSKLVKKIKKSIEKRELFGAVSDPNIEIFKKRRSQEEVDYQKENLRTTLEEKIYE